MTLTSYVHLRFLISILCLDAFFVKMHGFKLPILLAPLLYAVGSTANEDVSVLSKETAKANNESLLWGPYKPNLYFGVRPRLPDSFFAGLMWAKVDDFVNAQQSKWPFNKYFASGSVVWCLGTEI